MSGHPLTVAEVERHARDAIGHLRQLELPAQGFGRTRWRLDQALAALNELLLLVDLVDLVHDGVLVVVDPDRDRPA